MKLSWIDDLIHGEKAAGDRFVVEHYARIYRLLRHLTGHTQAAEDLTQTTFIKAWQALPRFQRKAQLATWLHKIAYHEYAHWLRAKRDHAALDAYIEMPTPQPDSDFENFVLPSALSCLSEEQRSVFVLYYLQELNTREIAEVLDIPAGTVKSRLFTARQNLRDVLTESEMRDKTLALVSQIHSSGTMLSEPSITQKQTLNALLP